MVHTSEGKIATQLEVSKQNSGTSELYAYSGRWLCHNESGLDSRYSKPLIEHHISASSLPSLVGKAVCQEYSLSDDQQVLTTSNLQMMDGSLRILARLEWQRLA